MRAVDILYIYIRSVISVIIGAFLTAKGRFGLKEKVSGAAAMAVEATGM